MKTKPLLKRFSKLLDRGERRKKVRRKELRAALKALKQRQKELEAKYVSTRDEEKRRKIEREIRVIREQRRKGIRLCRELGCK